MTSPVAVVVACGRRGRAIVPTLRCATAAGAAEVIVAAAADDVDDVTRLARISAPQARVVSSGQTLAEQRRDGFAATDALVVAHVDAGSLFTASWLEGVARSAAEGVVVRPELAVSYGAVDALWPQEQPSAAALLPIVTPWAAPFAATRGVLAATPCPQVPDSVVDASWQAEFVRAGRRTVVVDHTAVFIRAWDRGELGARARGEAIAGLGGLGGAPDRSPRRPRRTSPAIVRRIGRAAASVARPWSVGVRRLRRRLTARTALPSWLSGQLGPLHGFEPLIPFPGPLVGDRYVRHGDPWPKRMLMDAERFQTLRAAFPEKIDYLFFAPWLRLGGGDQVLLDYATAVRRLDPEAAIGLITTESVRSTRLAALPPGTSIVELMDSFDPRHERDLLADHLLPQLIADLRPHTIHAFNSTLAFDVVERHPDAISAALFLSSFAIDRAATGEQTSALFHRSPTFLDPVCAVLVDNPRFVERLAVEHGYDPDRFVVQPHIVAPFDGVRSPGPHPDAGSPLRVLWVGRFDIPKRLDILADVAATLAENRLPVIVEFYGHEEMGDPRLRETLARLEDAGAVRYPPYDGFSSLPLARFGAYIMTSEWEGLPLSLLEAMSAGLPVIAPDVGAVSTVVDDDTGYLIERFDDVEAYVSALEQILRNPSEAAARGERGRMRVRSRNSREAFDSSLLEIKGYLREARRRTSTA